jgi:hypothetical protein
MMLSPLLALYYGPAAAVLIIAVMEVAVSVQLVPRALNDVEWPFLIPVTAAALVGMPLGVWALTAIDSDLIARFIAAMVLVFVIVLATGWRYRGPKRLPITLGLGAFSGSLLTSTSVGGPPLLIYMMAGRTTAVQVRANIIVYFAVVELVTPLMLWLGGRFDAGFIIMGALFCPPYLIGAWLGSRFFDDASELLYRRIALILLTLIALYGLVRPLD